MRTPRARACVYSFCLLGHILWWITVLKVLFVEMYVNTAFVMRFLYSAVILALVRERRFMRIIYYNYYHFKIHPTTQLQPDDFFVYVFVSYSCVAPTFFFEWNKKALDVT